VLDVAAALASMARGGKSLLVTRRPETSAAATAETPQAATREPSPGGGERPVKRTTRRRKGDEAPQATYRLEVGRRHGVQPGNIVGALAHEADLHGSEINGVEIREDHTLVRLPADIPDRVLDHLRGIRVRGQPLAISRMKGR
jgi:ATP-dependent RNA helicase DeaD